MTTLRTEPAVRINRDPDRLVRVGDLELNVAGIYVLMGRERVALPLREFEVLLLLADNAGRVLSPAAIVQHVWGPAYQDVHGTLKVHINRLRKRMRASLGVDYIRTVRGAGYCLEAPA